MAQAELDFTNNSMAFLQGYGISNITWSPSSKTIICMIDDKLSVVITKRRNGLSFTLRKGTQSLSLPHSTISSLCDFKGKY